MDTILQTEGSDPLPIRRPLSNNKVEYIGTKEFCSLAFLDKIYFNQSEKQYRHD